ncbi:MAG: M42 family metallopeptidase [Candidatus Krumholzibacteriota bacterium]|nr:M42 family metallopeptidase [Candidatus Krumholzibacteriota bacterium]
MDRIEKMMKEFTETAGVSGAEEEVFALMEKHLGKVASIEKCGLGSFVGRLKKGRKKPRVMIAGHMDEVGLMVSHFSGSFIKFNKIGGWWAPRLLGLQVRIKTSKGWINGVIASKSPFHMEAEERKKEIKAKDLYIDIGLTGDEKPEDLGVMPGDPVVPDTEFLPLNGGRTYLAKAWDNRIGCMAVVEALKKLSSVDPPCGVYGVGTVQEEVGLRGAVTSGHYVNPDVALAVDVGIAQDIPGAPEGGMEKLGGGVSICVYDASLIPNRKLRDLVVSTAEKKKIPYHFSSISVGGTDGGKLHMDRSGVPAIVFGIPTRYIHSGAGILDRSDFDNAVKLIVEVVKSLDEETVRNLI